MLAIIGGSALGSLANLRVSDCRAVRTPYGEPSGALTFGTLGGHDMLFLARHGDGHTLPPHEINYRANIWALHAAGVKNVVAVSAVGGIRSDFNPGVLTIPHQIIDYTHGRASTYFAREDRGLCHIDFTLPYCGQLRAACLAAAQQAGISVIDGGVYAATQGPRLETAAEVNRIEHDGGDMVGMTGMPEAVLAKEIGLCYAAIAVVANHAAGRSSSRSGIAMDELSRVLVGATGHVQAILEKLVTFYGD